MKSLFFDVQESPIGPLRLMAEGDSLTGIHMLDAEDPTVPGPGWVRESAPFAAVREQLAAYFAGALTRFDLPLAPRGTPFQLRVWERLREIPYGETMSYAQLALQIGEPRAIRAVGAANGRNPLPIVVPCHRVIGADGSLTGYAGGLERKRLLLELEGSLVAAFAPLL